MFNREAEAVLDGLFGDLHAQKTKKGAAVIVDAGPPLMATQATYRRYGEESS